MIKFCLLFLLFAATSNRSFAQQDSTRTFPVVVSFQSECCGVPSQTSLRNYIKSFKKKYKIKKAITAERIGPMGREGEFYLAFTLKELSKTKATYFIKGVKKIKKLSADKGSMEVKENMEIDPATLPGRFDNDPVKF